MERPKSPARSLDSATEKELNLLWKKLRAYVRKNFPHLADRYSLDGIIHQAIINYLNGKRRYPPIDKEGCERTDVTLFAFLCGTIRSHASHLYAHDKRLPPPSSLNDLENPIETQDLRRTSKLFLLRQAEQGVGYDLLVRELLEPVKDDHLLCQMIKLWAADPNLKPSDMADELGVEMPEMRAAQKRLKRRLANFRRKK